MIDTWNKTAVLGGDARLLAAARRLADQGHEVAVWGVPGDAEAFGDAVRAVDWSSAIRGASVILLPLPASSDGVRINLPADSPAKELRFTRLLEAITPEQRLFGGRFPPAFKAAAEERDIVLYDYSENELFQIRNALPTAEGAVEIALHELPVTLAGTPVAVIGYGRIGKVLARLLRAMDAEVTVAARRNTDLAWITLNQYHPLRIESAGGQSSLTALGDRCRVIFNTVPHWLFDRTVLSALRPDTLIIDLASSPGGVDPQAATDCGIRVIRALSLPGKCAPQTAGEIIADTVITMMAREGVELQ